MQPAHLPQAYKRTIKESIVPQQMMQDIVLNHVLASITKQASFPIPHSTVYTERKLCQG